MSGYEDFVEYRKKKQKEREVAASRYALKNPTIDDNFINNYIAQSESFVNNTINDYSTANYEGLDDFRSALDSFESQASTLRAQRLLIEDAFNKLPESKNKQDALDFLNERANSINKTWELLKNLRSDFDGEESNFYQYKFGNNVTYDKISNEINRLLERQKTESDNDSKETQKSIDVLTNLKYNTNYNSVEDYDKAILDATEKVKKLEEDDKAKTVVITASSGKRNTEEITFLKNQIAKLQANKELAEFYEIPNKAGTKFIEYWAEEYKKNSANPTVDEILNWFDTEHESGDTIAINDPLGFVEDNPDLYGQYNPSSNIGTLVLPIFDKAQNYHWNQINEKERAVYYYTLGTKGKEEALRYLDLLAPTFGQRFRNKLSQAFSDVYDKHGVLAYVGLNAVSVPLNAIGGLMATVDNFADMATERKINPYSQSNTFRIVGETIREETTKDIEASTSAEFLGKNILSQVYQLGMSFIDSTVGGAIMGPAYSFVLGSGAAASEAEEVYNRGGTPGQIFAASFAAGLAETIAEYIPLNKLFGESKPNVTSLRRGVKTALSQAMTEASEEFLTEITNTVVDDVIMQERSAINERAAYLMEQGMSSGEAYGKAFSELLSDVAWAPLGGLILGGFGGATLSTASAISNRGYIGYVNRVGKTIKSTGDAQNLIDYAKQFDTDEINDLLKGTTAKSSNNKIGQIYQAIVEATRSDMSKIQSHADLARYIESKANSTPSQNIKNILGIEYFNIMQNTYWKDGVDNWSNLRANTALGGKGNAPEISNVRQYGSGNDYVMGNYTDPTEQEVAEEETESILPNISAQGPEADPVADAAFKARGVERLTDDQKFIKKVGKAFGREVVFENLDEWRTDENGNRYLFSPNGYFNKKTKQIVINSNKKTLNALEFVFKHELTHFVENNSKEKYDNFVKALKESKEFEEWLNKKLGSSDGTLDVKLATLNERIREERKKAGKPVGVAKAEAEIIANFVGQILFEKNGTTLDSLVENASAKNKPIIIQWLLDVVKWLKEKLSGNKDFSFELQRLESKFVEMLKDAEKNAEQKQVEGEKGQKENSTEDEVEYNAGSKVIDLSNDNDLSKIIGDSRGSEKYKAIQNYILDALGGQPITLSDGKKAVVDRSDALHIANKAANKKTAQISKIKELVETAELYAEDNNVEHDKFNYFCYYKADVRYENEVFPLYLNVGKGKNDGKYHVYDITNKIRDTADRINGLERPKPNEGYALTNDVSKISIPNSSENVKQDLSPDKDAKNTVAAETTTPNPALYNKQDGKNGWLKDYKGFRATKAREALDDALKYVNPELLAEIYYETVMAIEHSIAHQPLFNEVSFMEDKVRGDDYTPMQAAEMLSDWYESHGLKEKHEEWLTKHNIPRQGEMVSTPTQDVAEDVVPQAETDLEAEDIQWSIPPETAAEYMEAVENGDMETAQRLVNEAAREWGAITNGNEKRPRPLNLYHGTGTFGFTRFRDGAIYATTAYGVAAGYNRGKGLGRVRNPSVKYIENDGTAETAIKNAKSVLGANLTMFDAAAKQEVINKADNILKNVAQKVAEIDESTDYAKAGEFFDYITEKYGKEKSIQWTNQLDNLHYMLASEYTVEEILENGEWLKHDLEKYHEWKQGVSELWSEESEAIKKASLDKTFRYLLGYEYGDSLIDIEYGLGRLLNDKEKLVNENGSLIYLEDVIEAIEAEKDVGVYNLYGKAGDSPLVIDEGNRFWDAIPFEGGFKSTDYIVNWAKEKGYTSVLFKSILDPSADGSANVYADEWVFLSPKLVKSADPVTYDDNGNVIPLSQRFNKENDDILYSMPSDENEVDYTAKFDEVSQQFERGDITRADFVEQVKALYTEAGNNYDTIEKGEAVTGNENFKNPVPKTVDGTKNVRRYVRTVMEGGELTEDMLTVEKQQVLSGDVSYTPTSNEANMKYADNAMVNGTAETIWEGITKGTAAPNAGAIAVGEALLKDAINRKDTVSVVTLVAELSELGTRLGQSVQALSLLKRMSGVGQLYYVKKAVDKLNKDLQQKHKNNPPTVVINETLANQLAESTTEEDFNISYTAIMNDIAEQVPATFLDKWNAWRYMAMLFNPVTHIRNFFGNAFFVPVVMAKDAIGTVIESTSLKDKSKRSKSIILKKEYLDFAKKDFVFVERKLKSGGKYNPSKGITENKKIFKGALEKARKFNFDLLEEEDTIFLKVHYVRAMASYLQAQKVDIKTASPQTITLAREYAQKEALKATYRDMSAIANAVSNFANKHVVANVFVDGILPFKKTPINIVKRGIEYSPLGLMKTITKGVYDLKKGNISASEFIDGIAGGLTGTGIVALGMLFSSLGLAVGGSGDDEESWYDKMLGKQEYALEIGGVSYTIDWMAPACMPFFMGVSIAESMRDEGNENFISSVANSLTSSIEPYINLSMLSGIRNTIATARYAEEKQIFSKVLGEMIGNYASQLLPAIGAKLANTIDGTRRSNYIDKTSMVPEFIQSAINTVLSKSPVASMLRPEYINAWGESENQGNFAKRFFQSFLSPGYVSSIEVDNVDVELKRLAKETSESGVFPKVAPKKIDFKGITKHLTAEEYVNYSTQKGQMSADFVSDAIKNPKYKQLDDSQKATVIKNLYSYANVKAKLKINYTSEEISQMYDKLSAKDKENATSKKDAVKQTIIQSEKGAYNYEIDGGDVVEYYIEKELSKK